MTTKIAPAPLLDQQQLAAYLGVDASTIWRWRTEGKPLPPSIKLGALTRWRLRTVDAWLAELESQEAA